MRRKYRARVIVRGAAIVAALVALYAWLDTNGGMSFYRAVPFDNDPLTNSIAASTVSSNRFVLADGRVLVMLGYSSTTMEVFTKDFGGRIELGSIDSGMADVYVKQKVFYCGTHAPRVIVPLIRRTYPLYERRYIGVGALQ